LTLKNVYHVAFQKYIKWGAKHGGSHYNLEGGCRRILVQGQLREKKNVGPYLKKQASIALYTYVSAMWEVMTRDCPGQKCSALA
jgi:hypothetical protein